MENIALRLRMVFVILLIFFLQGVLMNKEIIDNQAGEKLKDSELKERIGQMMIVGFKENEVSDDSDILQIIREVKVGGLVFYRRNISSPEQVKKLISALQRHSSVPLFIAVDAEGGERNRLESKSGFSDFLSAKELGKIDDYEFTKQEALRLSQELKELGFNINFAPVVDVDINPENPIIGTRDRSFSADAYKVVLHAQAVIEMHRQNNVIAIVKHFPGHGSSTQDSHLGKVDVTALYKEEELLPYKLLQEKGLIDAVMTAHIINKKIDKYHHGNSFA